MKIIISPAMKMKVDQESFPTRSIPQFITQAKVLADFLKKCSLSELKTIWQVSERTAKEGQNQLFELNLAQTDGLTPAIISYSGIQYQYMAPDLFTLPALEYLQKNVRILSGLYGVLKPFDGVWPYRLEMKNKMLGFSEPNLYKFWNSTIADSLFAEDQTLINLASKEYSKIIMPYLTERRRMINIEFQEKKNDSWKVVGVHAKMARGEMVRLIAEEQLSKPEDLQKFNDFGFKFVGQISDENNYVFRTEYDFKRH
ncbi:MULTISPECIES: peroxide stress protein YaaA [unclassified Lactobacillus]|uniref:peroxide stress protein YaaA n=1 Tax=unclassified Lactobacillus TaxID=2620435 RepID=UPI000EFB8C84|nr:MULTISPECIES: peroxide stress protein YaaA [unclassified Lactobacillus]RMC25754.1 peroxide stress protein YaaA [Lactobacillus sp. ESL0247]RMC29566.1 peroxide stress protein YaaA [Lactobacillus sp. ESL0246]RMC33555.1 peroxide stress protein YaaA [Lactobacillus sp. ESL0245]